MSSYRLHAANRHPTDRCPGFITDLILRCAEGDEAALGSLFDQLFPLVAGIVRDHAGAGSFDDVVVAIFGRIWHDSSAYDPKMWESVAWVVSQATSELADFTVGATPGGPVVLTC